MSDFPAPLPPPLPPAADAVVYATRNDAFSPPWTLRLAGGQLTVEVESGRGQSRVLDLAQAEELRLEFAPTRFEPGRYRCRLRLRGGAMVTFYNRRYEGLAAFCDTSGDYRAFVTALIAAIARYAPDCHLVAGSGTGNYMFGLLGFMVAAVAVMFVAVWSLRVGLWWLVIVKALILVFYFPTAVRWLRRNRQRAFPPHAPPPEVLPRH